MPPELTGDSVAAALRALAVETIGTGDIDAEWHRRCVQSGRQIPYKTLLKLTKTESERGFSQTPDNVSSALAGLEKGWPDLLAEIARQQGEEIAPDVRLVEQPPERDELEAALFQNATESLGLIKRWHERDDGERSGFYDRAAVERAVKKGIAPYLISDDDDKLKHDMAAAIMSYLDSSGEEPTRGKRRARR